MLTCGRLSVKKEKESESRKIQEYDDGSCNLPLAVPVTGSEIPTLDARRDWQGGHLNAQRGECRGSLSGQLEARRAAVLDVPFLVKAGDRGSPTSRLVKLSQAVDLQCR
jgi:hypothetical protein